MQIGFQGTASFCLLCVGDSSRLQAHTGCGMGGLITSKMDKALPYVVTLPEGFKMGRSSMQTMGLLLIVFPKGSPSLPKGAASNSMATTC